MTYSESARNVTISRKRAYQELRTHGIDETCQPDFDEFTAWLGNRETVNALRVLEWLGY